MQGDTGDISLLRIFSPIQTSSRERKNYLIVIYRLYWILQSIENLRRILPATPYQHIPDPFLSPSPSPPLPSKKKCPITTNTDKPSAAILGSLSVYPSSVNKIQNIELHSDPLAPRVVPGLAPSEQGPRQLPHPAQQVVRILADQGKRTSLEEGQVLEALKRERVGTFVC